MSISGNLHTMPFADLLQWVAQSRKTGTLVIEGEPHNKKIYFKEGTIAGVASENPKEYLGFYMVGWGLVQDGRAVSDLMVIAVVSCRTTTSSVAALRSVTPVMTSCVVPARALMMVRASSRSTGLP